jgi:amidase
LDEVGREPGRLRIGYTTKPPLDATVEPCFQELVEDTAKLLEELGHEVFEASPAWPDPEQARDVFLTVWYTASAYFDLGDWEQAQRINRATREAALGTDSIRYVQAVAEMQIVSRIITSSWGRDFDVLLTPTMAVEPPKVGAIWEGYDADPLAPLMTAAKWVPFTPLLNVTGQPAISLPLGTGPNGLPLGVQLVGAPWDEAGLIRLSAQIEKARPWRGRHPEGL